MSTYFLIGALVVAVIGAVEDFRRRRIPNRLTYSGFLAGLLIRFFMLGAPGLMDGLIAALLAGGVLFLLFLLRAMGAGDVKLIAAVSAWAGRAQVVNLLAAASVAGGLIAVGVILYRRRVRVTLMNTVELLRHHVTAGLQPHPELNLKQSGSGVPFAPAIAIGTLYCLSRTYLWG